MQCGCGEIIFAQQQEARVLGKQKQTCDVDKVFILCKRIPIFLAFISPPV